jgi:hypothetical protein
MKVLYYFPFYTLVVCLLMSCASKPVLQAPVRALTFNDFAKEQASRKSALSKVQGKLKLELLTRENPLSGSGRILAEFPDRFRVELRDPLGRVHYILFAKGEKVAAYFPRNKQATVDVQSGRGYFKRVLGAAWSAPELMALFFGIVPGHWDKKSLVQWGWDKERGLFLGQLAKGKEALSLWVDSSDATVRRLEWSVDGKTLDAEYSDFDSCCEAPTDPKLGFDAVVRFRAEDAAVHAAWDSLKPTKAAASGSVFEYQPSPGEVVSEERASDR